MSEPTVLPIAEAVNLPLRTEDPVSFALMLKVMLITALLLAVVYVVLRWYAQRANIGPGSVAQNAVQCTATLRLSARTKVYLLNAAGNQVLVTETSTGVSVTRLTERPAPNADAPQQDAPA